MSHTWLNLNRNDRLYCPMGQVQWNCCLISHGRRPLEDQFSFSTRSPAVWWQIVDSFISDKFTEWYINVQQDLSLIFVQQHQKILNFVKNICDLPIILKTTCTFKKKQNHNKKIKIIFSTQSLLITFKMTHNKF